MPDKSILDGIISSLNKLSCLFYCFLNSSKPLPEFLPKEEKLVSNWWFYPLKGCVLFLSLKCILFDLAQELFEDIEMVNGFDLQIFFGYKIVWCDLSLPIVFEGIVC